MLMVAAINWDQVSAIAGFAVAVGTGALAIATFVMAKAARDETMETRKLRELAERQLELDRRHVEATALPVLRIARGAAADECAIWMSNGSLMVTLENRGAVTATIEDTSLTLSGGGGVIGSTVGGDVIGPEQLLTVEYELAAEQVTQALGAEEILVKATYTAPGSEVNKRLRVVVRPKDGGDRWLVLSELIV
jgi:hypothetical protein